MLTTEQKLEVIKDVHSLCYRHAMFSDAGRELAYITLAILNDMRCELNPLSALILLLKKNLSCDHAVWHHIKLEPTVLCINCESEVLWDQASYCPPLNGWLGHNCCVDASDDECYYEEVSFN